MTRAILTVLLLLFAPNLAMPQRLSILVPNDNAEVPWRTCLYGTTSDPSQNLVAVVHPRSWSIYFVAPALSIGSHGEYESVLYIGESTAGFYEGQQFEIQVFSDPNEKLREGMRLSAWPVAKAVSPLIRVVRRDDAPSGCWAVPYSSTNHVGVIRVNGGPNPRALMPPATSASIGARSSYLKLIVATVYGVGVILFVVMALMKQHADVTANLVSHWIKIGFLSCFVTLRVMLIRSVRFLWGWVVGRVKPCAEMIWRVKGCGGTLRQFALKVVVIPVLSVAFISALLAGSRAVVLGLDLIFGVGESQTSDAQDDTILGNILMAHGEASAAQAWPVTSSKPAVHPIQDLIRNFGRSFGTVWAEKLGFMAIGLAGLQGACGLVLLWGSSTDEAVRIRPLHLLKERPLLTGCFVVLDFALALLAANRGYELSQGANWLTPSLISGLLGIVLPWVMALTLHFAIECAADCLSIAEWAALLAGLGLVMIIALLAWVLISLGVVCIVAIAFGGYFLLLAALWVFVQFAKLWGDFVRTPPAEMVLVRAALSSLLVVALLAGGGYLMLRGVIQ